MADRRIEAEDAARRKLRAGIAKVAEQAKAEGRAPVDCRNHPLKYATEMMNRHSASTLAKWRRGGKKTIVVM